MDRETTAGCCGGRRVTFTGQTDQFGMQPDTVPQPGAVLMLKIVPGALFQSEQASESSNRGKSGL